MFFWLRCFVRDYKVSKGTTVCSFGMNFWANSTQRTDVAGSSETTGPTYQTTKRHHAPQWQGLQSCEVPSTTSVTTCLTHSSNPSQTAKLTGIATMDKAVTPVTQPTLFRVVPFDAPSESEKAALASSWFPSPLCLTLCISVLPQITTQPYSLLSNQSNWYTVVTQQPTV